MKIPAAIGICGAFGALARYGISGLTPASTGSGWPWATFICNIAGSFLLGLLYAAVVRYGLPLIWKEALGTGFLGAYTTFSAFSLESFNLIREGFVFKAAGYVLLSVLLGVIAASLGTLLLPPKEEGK